MKYVTFERDGAAAVGVVTAERVIALADLVPEAPADMIGVIRAGDGLRDAIQAALTQTSLQAIPLASLPLLAPIPQPGKFICMGLNYVEHIREGGKHDRPIPDYPTLFLRVQSSLIGPADSIRLPRSSSMLDYEAEILVVIGRKAHDVPVEEALDCVFGYSAFNDGSLRDFQRQTGQWTAGKNFDATGPFGPVIVTADELPPGARDLAVRSRLNGQIMQDGNSSDMIFPVAEIISYVSKVMTLEPGDLIATGTPSGVGAARTPPVFMRDGDVIEVEIEGIPALRNRVVAA